MSSWPEAPPAGLAAPLPKVIWIELTSKCPFDCVFCSRKNERGAGRHMDFSLYSSLIGQLDQPEIIRLNYSGESLHYPQLAAAIRLARATGATTELVTALGSAPLSALESIVDEGLHRLSVSLHTMDAAQFPAIYQRGELPDILTRLETLLAYRQRRGSRYPEVDFAFVAMRGNLSQLLPVVAHAWSLGITSFSVHPVIRRGQAPLQFPQEVDEAGCLREGFDSLIRAEVERAASAFPSVAITVARPEAGIPPDRRGITTCEQNPWDTVHVLANGGVVVCEVQDRVEIGNLNDRTLSEIWNGPAYAAFRRQYFNGAHPSCVKCPWRRTLATEGARKVMVRGWRPSDGDPVEWSGASAAIAIPPRHGATGIRIAGILPNAPPESPPNSLRIQAECGTGITVQNATGGLLSFEAELPMSPIVQFETLHRFCPAERGTGTDIRKLGFALTEVTFAYERKRRDSVRWLLELLEKTGRLAARFAPRRPRIPKHFSDTPGDGVSLLVPARDTPSLLVAALAAAEKAVANLSEPMEIIVVVSAASPASYSRLRSIHPLVRWIFRDNALDFGAAVELGLRSAAHPWLYLLNSDMLLHPDAIAEVLKLRRADTFAVGSRIKMRDGSNRESNWTDLRFHQADAAELVERDPEELREPRGCLYAGGGSSLFRTSLLKRFIRQTRAYAPFYWEDVEWGARAWRGGFQCIFCPSSLALHGHRETISRYYGEPEITRIFERNRTLFHLRNLDGIHSLEERLLSLDPRTWQEIFQPSALAATPRARAAAFAAQPDPGILRDRWRLRP